MFLSRNVKVAINFAGMLLVAYKQHRNYIEETIDTSSLVKI